MTTSSRHILSVARGATAIAVGVSLAIFVVQAVAGSPAVTSIDEPALGSAPLNPGDVHMVASFADDEAHVCTDWEIRRKGPGGPGVGELVWEAPCATGPLAVHIHLGDGTFQGSHAGRLALEHSTEYLLRVRSRDGEAGEESLWLEREFSTRPPGPPGDDAVSWNPRQGYAVEVFARDLQLPVSIAMVPEPGPHPGDPFMYVTELYGNVKVVTRDGTVRDYATGLLNFNPTGNFPGSGEIGLTGIAVEPASGDVFVSLVYAGEDFEVEPTHHPKVLRLYSDEPGLEAVGETTVLDMANEVQGQSHQVSNLTITPAGELFVHNGDGILEPDVAQELDKFQGKILRMSLSGEPLPDNPFYAVEDEETDVSAEDYVYAYGLRNPFGGALRLADGAHFLVENGPSIDRLAPIVAGENYLWPGDSAMQHRASYRWIPSHAPVAIEFVEPGRFGGSGFPAETLGHAFVTESGPTWESGPQELGKRIVEFDLDSAGKLLGGPDILVEYGGTGKATAVGLAAGEDGLYFTDLYKDKDFSSPIDRGANVLRVRYCADDCPVRPESVPPEPEARPEVHLKARHFRMRRKAFAVQAPDRRRPQRKRRASHGTAFLYWLSERATVSIEIRRGSRTLATLRAPGKRGPNRRPFAGRLRRGPLPPGQYLATLRARTSGGGVARASTWFRVVSRR